jgi:hypothetical protein
MTQYKPHSHFFTDLAFTQFSGTNVPDVNAKSFGPLDENRFQITTTFKGTLNAYAVVKGILLIGKQAGSTDKINILLKPTEDIGLGIKIKYFVYRGINASDFFKNLIGTALVDETSYLEFITKAWDAYVEFNQNPGDLEGSKIGFIDGSGGLTTEVLRKYFNKDNSNLLKVEEGSPLGKFALDSGGFEVVVDEGDFSQISSDTGLNIDLTFVTATSTILNTNKDVNHPSQPNEFGSQSDTNLDVRIFRENIYKFLDPAAFYGSHITDLVSKDPSGNITNNKGGIIKVKNNNDCKTPSQIYDSIVSKFINKNKTYLYIRSTAGRSYNFYNEYDTAIPDIAFGLGHTQPVVSLPKIDFEKEKWPLLILLNGDKYTIALQPNIKNLNYLYSAVGNLGDKNIFSSKDLFSPATNAKYSNAIYITYPSHNSNGNSVISSLCYLYHSKDSSINNFFGPLRLDTIFEMADFSDMKGSYINHLRPVLLEDDKKIGLYHTKIIFEENSVTDKSLNLRTFIILPDDSTTNEAHKSNILKAGYYGEFSDPEKYCDKLYGGGEFWQGGIVDENNVTINSLLYKKDLDEDEMPIFQIGVSQKDLEDLHVGIAAGSSLNHFFYFDQEDKSKSSYLKYSLKIQYELLSNGVRAINTSFISVYTLDGYFFFTKDYATHFSHFKTFANATVEFRPHEFWYGEFGMDWYRKGQHTWPSTVTPEKIYDNAFDTIVGSMPTQVDGNDTSKPFVLDFKMLSKLKRKEYSVYPVNWTIADNERECFASWLSLDKGKTAELNLRIRIKKNLSTLVIRYPNKYFKIGNSDPKDKDKNYSIYSFPPAQKTASNTAQYVNLSVTCTGAFNKTQILQVLADNKSAGALKAFPNDPKPTLNVLFVPIRIKLPDSSGTIIDYSQKLGFFTFQKDNLDKFLAQSQIKANIEMFSINGTPPPASNFDTWDLSGDANFNSTYYGSDGAIFYIKAYYENNPTALKPVKNYLLDNLPAFYQSSKYKNYLKVFFINNPGNSMINATTIGTRLGGYSDGYGTPVQVFDIVDTNTSSIAHEIYHSLGMPHVFDRTQERSQYLYKPGQTDNIMDYSLPKPEESLFHWQWVLAREACMQFYLNWFFTEFFNPIPNPS